MTSNVFDNPGEALSQAKEQTNDVLRSEIERHEAVLEGAMLKHEAIIRIENEYHKQRTNELERIISMLDARMPPESELKDTRPHSRACGIRPHDHGVYCSSDCPTCKGD